MKDFLTTKHELWIRGKKKKELMHKMKISIPLPAHFENFIRLKERMEEKPFQELDKGK